MITLETKIENFPRVGQKYASKLKKLGIETVRDLLFHFPFRYDDYSQIFPISQVVPEQVATVQGKITKTKTVRTWKKRMFITEIFIQDDSGTARAVWFNQPYLIDNLKEGKEIRLSGKVSSDTTGLYFSNPAWERTERTPTNTGRLVPVYPETEGLTSRWLRWQIQNLFKLNLKIADPIPPEILKKLKLLSLERAIRQIHFPENMDYAKVAQKRFAFEEMLLVQLKSLQIKISRKKESAAKIKFDEKLIKNFVSQLPFKLTGAQRKSAFQILKDLEKNQPMNRLLNGDVGSGKTVVAAIACLQTLSAEYQAVIMAPTEILARQHFENICKMFAGHNFNIALFTNSYRKEAVLPFGSLASKSRTALLERIKSGGINLIIGTHSLIQKDIRFKNLALVIVDEQHRFGVAQRAYLEQKASEINDGIKGKVPHFLTMTATPIPRTLALAFFGNLNLSLLDEMPKNRKKIITKIISPRGRSEVYEFAEKEIKKGRQVFIILPLVEESKILTEIKAATQERDRLAREIFPDLKIGLLHGKMKSNEKEKVMAQFSENKLAILVSTAVVEVGIDIPNAAIMIIEDADRFGLSQLHQFRGRVGRGKHQSYCFLFTQSNSAKTKARLKALVESEDGFKIAEKDLELRGPGEFFGTRQSGLPDIAMENLANVRLIKIAREEAQTILQTDPELDRLPLLKNALQRFDEKIHLE